MPMLKSKNGINWNYDIEGQGENLLFIHGRGVDRRIWRQQVKHFSDCYRVVSVDLPGHGESSWEHISLDSMAEDFGEILEKEDIEKVSIVGSSLGGMVALKFYDFHSEKIGRMIFVGSITKF